MRLLLFGVLALIGCIPGGRAADIPVEVIFQRQKYGAIALSPDGMYLASVVRFNGRNNLEVVDLVKSEAKAVTKFDDSDVVWFTWLNNKRLLFRLADAQEASGRARSYGWHAVNRDGSEWQRLGQFRTFVSVASGGGDDIVVIAAERGRTIYDVYRMNTYNARTKLLSYDSPGDVVDWVVDRKDVPRLAHSYLKGIHSVWYRESDGAPWTKIDEGTDLQLHFTPLGFDYDDKTLYVASRAKGDKASIYTYDPIAKKLGELIAGSPRTDINRLIFSRNKRALIGVEYEGDGPGVTWFDPERARLQKTVDRALPDTFNVLQVADENPHRALVFAYSDVNPGVFYLLDTEKLTLEELGKSRPWIDVKQLAERKAVHYAARDGLEIPGYLTLPKDSGDKKVPLVVIIHGGPWVRGFSWGFDLDAQFLASRGYAVLEPEFRGSVGHGWKLFSSGFKQWGLAMQDDITDGVEWLIKRGIVDKDRICLYGGSYGGYAVLWGLIKTPELYKCGVAYVAVTDLHLLFEIDWDDLVGSPYRWFDYGARDLIGDPGKDAEKFRSVSPLVNADRLRAPVLLAYGGRDERVPSKHGNEFRAALDKYGKSYEWIVYRDEGHGFNKDENRFDFYRRVDVFLKKHLQ